ncbi:MAG: arginine--tRNA ligase, partial [Candidatus Micrarchaeota archaeon]|nr:arginine--tRNA ligase [Candidatus Micrarchaeota archaeon]
MVDAYSEANIVVADLLRAACEARGYAVAEDELWHSLGEAKPKFGDIASTIAFSIAKKEKKNPLEVAKQIAEAVQKHELVEAVTTAGPYVNFRLSAEYLGRVLINVLSEDENYGRGDLKGLKVMVEFPSVNPNKPWHVGHLRNAVLGDCVARIMRFSGYEVERADYIDDLGLQVAQSVWGMQNLGGTPSGKFDQWLGEQYVEVAKRISEPEIETQVREILRKMEEGNNETASTARELSEECVKSQYQTAFSLNIYHDLLIWESDIVRSGLLEKGLELMRASSAVIEETEGANKGCLVAKLADSEEFKDMKSPDKVLVRSDGTTTYTGKDISFHLWKFGIIPSALKYSKLYDQPNGAPLHSTSAQGEQMEFGNADILVNVIGVEQTYPQKVVSSVLRQMGYENEASNMIHLAYEHAVLPDARLSGREGTWIGYTADKVVEEACMRALEEIKNRFEDMGDMERARIAKAVGVGAIRFSFIRPTPEKKLIFKWEEALSFEGDSAPYIQYSHARASRIIEKAGAYQKGDYAKLSSEEEVKLIKLLAKFPGVVSKSCKECRPHYVAEYMADLAAQFNKFYNTCPVIKAPEDV